MPGRPLRRAALACALAPLLLSPPAAAQLAMPVGLVDTQSSFTGSNLPSRGFYNIDAYLNVLERQGPTTAGYFWSQQFFFHNGDGGYMGLQTNGNLNNGTTAARVALFSIFDNNPNVERGLQSSHPNCQVRVTSGGDGTFAKCAISYNWQAGTEYRIRIYELCCAEQPSARERWGGWVRNMTTGVETFIGEISVPGGWGWLRTNANAFTEYFGPSVPACKDIPYTRARWRNPRADNGAHIATAGMVGGYGPCVSFARGYTLSGNDYVQTGVGNSTYDAIMLTVDHYYRSGLGREPDATGRNNQIAAVGTTTGTTCRDNLRGVARNMHSSTEFQQRWLTAASRVDRLYQSVLHRRPDANGRTTWINHYNATGSWSRVVTDFTNTTEATSRFGALCAYRY